MSMGRVDRTPATRPQVWAALHIHMASNVIQAKVNKTPCKALVDTRAMANCMSADFYKICSKLAHMPLDTSKARNLHDVSGNHMIVPDPLKV